MKMAERTLNLNALVPATYTYPFIDEPGVLRIYVHYKSTETRAVSSCSESIRRLSSKEVAGGPFEYPRRC